jgi:hypothetical protein
VAQLPGGAVGFVLAWGPPVWKDLLLGALLSVMERKLVRCEGTEGARPPRRGVSEEGREVAKRVGPSLPREIRS